MFKRGQPVQHSFWTRSVSRGGFRGGDCHGCDGRRREHADAGEGCCEVVGGMWVQELPCYQELVHHGRLERGVTKHSVTAREQHLTQAVERL